ncbi:hypothetical protein G3570_07760 [Balneolaceae bacterium YR4-1]|uniref:Transposase IS200-like domain-containing protein n=1 Tax=Halalkalibaculum roseum TaxID=2709311 RepID=A0A6M1SZB6_9BACT|nr:transposase [Halalkalibaculum roseum]NGP76524.1 hypothetical protein [Halalkalibaculum roseum]
MKKFKNKYRTDSIRLKGYDYSSEGIYFITICTKNRTHYFGSVIESKMKLSAAGQIVANEWLRTQTKRDRAVLGEWIVMPNHFHALIGLKPKPDTDASHASKAGLNRFEQSTYRCDLSVRKKAFPWNYKNSFGPQRDNIASIIRGFKGACTRQIRNAVDPDFSWHTGYYDHIVRNQESLDRIEKYIIENPLKWNKDRFH